MMIGIYKEITGDITKVRDNESGPILIPHVCNNMGVMGAGVALSIRNKWVEAYNYYKSHMDYYIKNYETHKDPIKKLLGQVSHIGVEHNLIIANMIAQHGTISSNPRPIKYNALVKCMEEVTIVCGSRYKICCPKFGSALAGGNWDFIKLLIEDIWLSEGIDVTVYNYG